jgi:hypothetical protein
MVVDTLRFENYRRKLSYFDWKEGNCKTFETIEYLNEITIQRKNNVVTFKDRKDKMALQELLKKVKYHLSTIILWQFNGEGILSYLDSILLNLSLPMLKYKMPKRKASKFNYEIK